MEAAGSVGACSAGGSSTCIEGALCSPVSVGGSEDIAAGSSSTAGTTFCSVGASEVDITTGSSSAAGSSSAVDAVFESAMIDVCSAATAVAGDGGTSLITGGSSVGSGDAEITSPPAKGEGPAGSAASAAASLAGLSAIGLAVTTPSFPTGGDSVAVFSDDGLDVPLMEAESESRSRSEGLGEPERTIGKLNAVEERRTAVPTRLHRDFLEGGDEETGTDGVADMVDR